MLVIIVQVKLLIKQHVHQEPLHQYQDPYPVLIVYQESMRRLMVRLSAMIVMMMNINRNQMQQTASKFKKVIIDQVQLQKLFVQLVKQEVVVVHCALNAMKGRIKTYQATPRALNVQLAGAMQVVGLLDVMRYHPDLILTMEFKIFVNVVTLVPELIHHKYRVQQGNTPTLLDQYHVFHVLPVNLQINMVVLNVLDARKDIFNLNRNNLPVKKLNLVQL
jgi:hypothetical protein